MSDIQALAVRLRDLNDATDWWNAAMVLALILTAFAAVAVVGTTMMALRRAKEAGTAQELLSAAKERDAITERDRIRADLAKAETKAKEADARIAEAQRGSAEANARATKAQESLALAEQHAAEANAKAEGFRADIARANESAAQAQAQVASAVAEATRATLELAKIKTPRTLNKEQQGRIAASIRAFPDTPFDLWVSIDSDSTGLMNSIDDVLRSAKWRFSSAGIIQIANKAGIIADSGVSIHFAEETRAALEAPALALGNALRAEGIPLTVFADQKAANADKDRTRIHIMIGSKPLN